MIYIGTCYPPFYSRGDRGKNRLTVMNWRNCTGELRCLSTLRHSQKGDPFPAGPVKGRPESHLSGAAVLTDASPASPTVSQEKPSSAGTCRLLEWLPTPFLLSACLYPPEEVRTLVLTSSLLWGLSVT